MTEGALSLRKLESVSSANLEKLSNKRIFFGHQSVGFNIIQGIGDVLREKGKRGFTFTESRVFSDYAGPRFLHSTIGQNTDPVGKIRDFEEVIRKGAANPVDLAFMKLCFVDINADTNLEALFAAYKDAMAHLKLDFPRTRFIHMTVPLVSRERGPKALVKALLGRTMSSNADNLAREKLNRMLRKEYADKEPLFDLAYLESTRKNNARIAYQKQGETYYALEAEYTDDGSHLGPEGRRLIAEQFLVFLAEI